MWSAPEPGRFRSRRRPALELGMTPLIDIVFLLLIFFMLTSRFVVQEGIQIDLPVTEFSHTLPAIEMHRIIVRSEKTLFMNGQTMTLDELDQYLGSLQAPFFDSRFEILAEKSASIQTVISLLEMLGNRGAARVTLGTERAVREKLP
jgi:biopolymer transport protein ExbD